MKRNSIIISIVSGLLVVGALICGLFYWLDNRK